MKNSKLKILVVLGLTFFCSFFMLAKPAQAAGALYFTPSSGSYPVGSTLKISVRVDTGGEAVNAVSAYFSYPTDLLDYSWISETGSFMTIWAEKQSGGGVVKLAGGLPTPGFSGRGLVATIGFKVKKTDQVNLTFISGSHVLRDSDNSDILSLSGSGKAAFSLVVPEPTQPQQTPTPIDETPPVISGLRISDISENSAVIWWKTDEGADSLLEYGIEAGKYLISVSQEEKTKEHNVSLVGLAPATTFYFRVASRDTTDNIARNEEQSFTTLTIPTPTPLPTSFYQNYTLWLSAFLLVLVFFAIFLLKYKAGWFKNLAKKLHLTGAVKKDYDRNQRETENRD